MKKPGVYVAIPSLGGTVSAQITALLADMMELRHSTECPWWFHYHVLTGCSPADYMRNVIVKAFLASSCERLWMIDGDMIPPTDWPRMLEVEADIVGGKCVGYWRKEDGGIALRLLAVRRVNGKNVGLMPNDDGPVDGVATGSILIHRRVFDNRRMRLPGEYLDTEGRIRDLWNEQDAPESAPPFFRAKYDAAGRRIATEDYDFCIRARALGYSVVLAGQWWDQVEDLRLMDVSRLATSVAEAAAK